MGGAAAPLQGGSSFPDGGDARTDGHATLYRTLQRAQAHFGVKDRRARRSSSDASTSPSSLRSEEKRESRARRSSSDASTSPSSLRSEGRGCSWKRGSST